MQTSVNETVPPLLDIHPALTDLEYAIGGVFPGARPSACFPYAAYPTFCNVETRTTCLPEKTEIIPFAPDPVGTGVGKWREVSWRGIPFFHPPIADRSFSLPFHPRDRVLKHDPPLSRLGSP